MSSGPKNNGLSDNNGANVLHFDHFVERLHDANVGIAAPETTETRDTYNSARLRFNSLTLEELSDELERRTKETQRLQEEVENATKRALERVSCTYSISSTPPHSCHTPMFNMNGSPGDSNIQSAHRQTVIQPLTYSLDGLSLEVARRDISFPAKEGLENAIEDYSQQVSDLQKQLNESHDQQEQQKFHFRQTIIKLQTKLQEFEMERDVLSDLRMKDSRTHADQMEKMLCMLEELQSTKRSGEQKLQETEDEAMSLSRKVETIEQTINEVCPTLMSQEKQCGHDWLTSPDTAASPRQLPTGDLAAKVLEEDFDNDTDKLQERLSLAMEQLGSEECQGNAGECQELLLKKQKERMEQLITSHDQEVATLTNKLSSSKSNNAILCVKLEQLQKHAERQASLHRCQVNELESALSIHKDKVCCLEQQLIQAQSQVEEAQRGRGRSLQQAEEFESQLRLLTRCGVQQWELQEEVKAVRGQLEAAWEQLHRAGEEEARLQALLEQRAQEGKKTQALLREKEEELQLRQQEAQQGRAQLEEAQGRSRTLRAEAETLRLKLDDREKMVEILRLQIESSAQMTVQHGRTIDNLHQEKSHLSNQLNQHKLEVQQLRAELDQHKSGLAALEQERHQLQASVSEQRNRVQEATLEKQQLTAQLEVQHMQLLTLTKVHKELQRLYSSKNEEHEGAALKLRNQLKNAHAELDQARSTLRTLEGADGHGLLVAMGMQEQITARREQIDSLQGRIQQLEETMEKLHQVKSSNYHSLESRCQVQELASVREEKRQLSVELEALLSKERQHRDRISELEAALHKMSESFADCQDFIQLQEQEFFRLKLQHALDLKELQGQNLRTALSVTPSALVSPIPSALTAPPSSQQASDTLIESQRLQESPTLELRSLVRELRGVISENHRPHTGNTTSGSSFLRRRSAPERVHRTAFCNSTGMTKEVTAGSKLTKETYSSESQLPRPAEPNGNNFSNTFNESHVMSSPTTAPRYTSSPQPVSLGRRSPVHCLLTSDPYRKQPQSRPEAASSLTNVFI
ncbi:coiled-coil domain-containing protein 158-like [Centroberyx affinis]|uniref:coiled-coil domain-containing protein 158-like n=1 Tax=Centroberyx affinis TaxID=166261 RepID=UPI003A5B9A9C